MLDFRPFGILLLAPPEIESRLFNLGVALLLGGRGVSSSKQILDLVDSAAIVLVAVGCVAADSTLISDESTPFSCSFICLCNFLIRNRSIAVGGRGSGSELVLSSTLLTLFSLFDTSGKGVPLFCSLARTCALHSSSMALLSFLGSIDSCDG